MNLNVLPLQEMCMGIFRGIVSNRVYLADEQNKSVSVAGARTDFGQKKYSAVGAAAKQHRDIVGSVSATK